MGYNSLLCLSCFSWDRPQNKKHNGLFRAFVPEGVSIESFTSECTLSATDEMNGRPRRKLGYHTPEELFDAFIDQVYETCDTLGFGRSHWLPLRPRV